MSRATGSSRNSSDCHGDSDGVVNSTPFSVMSAWSASGGSTGPVVEKSVPSFSVPLMLPLVLLNDASWTWSERRSFRKSP
jgi:hypothetical protein